MRKALPYLLCCLGFVLALTFPLAAQDWEVVNLNGRDYVTLHSFCEFYGFNYSLASGSTDFSTKNKTYNFQIPRGDAREVFLNGVHYWLSFPIAQNDKDWLISRIDVVNLFEPILRPHRIPEQYLVRGVVIDPGHGGADNGATSHIGTYEKNYALDTAFRLEKILQNAGIPTVITRRSDVFIPLEERVNIASRYQNYIFVSIHYNFATRTAHGLETYAMTPRGAGSTDSDGHVRLSDYQRLPGNAHDQLNILLGHEIHRQIIQLNPNDREADRGMKHARFVVLKDNTLPAVLVEGGFLTNRMEAVLIDQPDYRQSLAAAIARGIQNFIQVTKNEGSQSVAESPPVTGRLRVPTEAAAPVTQTSQPPNPGPAPVKSPNLSLTPPPSTPASSPDKAPSISVTPPPITTPVTPNTPSSTSPPPTTPKKTPPVSDEPSVTIYPTETPAPTPTPVTKQADSGSASPEKAEPTSGPTVP